MDKRKKEILTKIFVNYKAENYRDIERPKTLLKTERL